MSTWIDFKELRSKLRFSKLLEHYRVRLTVKGDKASGFCPLPTHQGARKSPSFSVELKRGIWQCFGCHAKGNALDFACRMEGFDPTSPQDLRKAAIKIRDMFLPGDGDSRSPKVAPSRDGRNAIVNAPIDFELQTLDRDHPYLRDRGFTEATIRHFGLGYCNRGMLKGRVAIPLHDAAGQLLGYAGRITRNEDISEVNPKYKFPGERERNGAILEFRKSLFLYNGHRLPRKVASLIIVEGFPSVWWLTQHGYPNTVALMGSDCSPEQAKLILDKVEADGRVWILSDGDAAGAHCAQGVLPRLSPYRFVRWAKLNDGEQPTDCAAEELEAMLSF